VHTLDVSWCEQLGLSGAEVLGVINELVVES